MTQRHKINFIQNYLIKRERSHRFMKIRPRGKKSNLKVGKTHLHLRSNGKDWLSRKS